MRLSLVALVLAFLLAAGTASAQELKIGIVDVQSVVMESDMSNAIKNHMQSKYGEKRKKLEKQGESLKKRAEELKNPKVSDKKRREFISEKNSLDQKFRALMQEAEQEQMKYNQTMVSQIFAAAKKVAESKGLNLILDVGQGGVLYADTAMNLTEDVLKAFNASYKENKLDLK